MSSIRTVLPMALVTCTSMLAMDLYLPAIPDLQRGLGLSVEQGQATVAVFLVGLGLSQLLWGAALQRLGPRNCVAAGMLGLWSQRWAARWRTVRRCCWPCDSCKALHRAQRRSSHLR